MKPTRRSLMLKFCAFLVAVLLAMPAAASAAYKLGDKVETFALKTADGKSVSLDDYAGKTVVLEFWSYQCPVTRRFEARMKKLAGSYKEKGVVVLAVAPNRNETKAQIKRYTEDQKLNFPVLIDEGNAIADLFDAKATPQVFLLDSQRKIRYIGAIDNGKDIGEDGREAYLENAVEAVLAGKEPPKAQTNAYGCMIKRDRG